MSITRRKFLQILSCSGAAVSLSQIWFPEIVQAITKKAGNLPVFWIQGQSCSGCSVSALNATYPDIAKVITEVISLEFHPTVMAAAGDLALTPLYRGVEKYRGKFVLVVEGSVPTGGEVFCTVGEAKGKAISFERWVKDLGMAAKAIINVGTCSAFGGIPAAQPNPTGAKAVRDIIPGATMINIPGCPPHPDWIVGTIAHVLLFGLPALDEEKRPKVFFDKVIHENCELRSYFEDKKFAKHFSEEGCLLELGCKGPIAHCDVSIRGWNNGVNWCVRSGSPCIGCTEPAFPFDPPAEGLYHRLAEEKIGGIPWARNLSPTKMASLVKGRG